MRFGPRSLFCQDPKAIKDALKLEKELIEKLRGVCGHQLQRLKLEERVLQLMLKEVETAENPDQLLAPCQVTPEGKHPIFMNQPSQLEEDAEEMEQSVSNVQQLSAGNFPNTRNKKASGSQKPPLLQDLDECDLRSETDSIEEREEKVVIHPNAQEKSKKRKRKKGDDSVDYPILYQLLNSKRSEDVLEHGTVVCDVTGGDL